MSSPWLRMPFSDAVEVNPKRSVARGTLAPFVDMAALPSDTGAISNVRRRPVGGGGSRFTNGDTLFARITPCTENGKTGLVDCLAAGEVATGSTEFIVLGPRPELTMPEFVYYLAKNPTFRSFAISRMRGTSGRQRVPASVLEDFEVGVPPLPEQRKIAAILSSVDDAIEKTQAVIDQVQVVKRGLMQELLTRGLPARHTRFKQTEIGEIPDDWRLPTLSQLAEIRRGASPRPIRDPKWFSDEGPGWVRIADVTRSDRFLRRTDQALSSLGESKSVPVVPGDLIMSICATIGKPIILDMDACIHDGFVVFRHLRTEVRRDFLYYQLQAAEQHFVGRGQPGTQKNLNTTIVGRARVPLPSIDEQDEIAQTLWATDDCIAANGQLLEELHRTKESLMSVLLTGELRVTP